MLNTVDSYTMEDGKLIFYTSKKDHSATFERMDVNRVANKYWKLKFLRGKPVQMFQNQEKEQYFMLKSDAVLPNFQDVTNSMEAIDCQITTKLFLIKIQR